VATSAAISTPTWCVPGWSGTRTEICGIHNLTLTTIDTKTEEPVGSAKFTVTQDIQLDNKGLTFAENFDIHTDEVEGTVAGSIDLAVTCGGTCSATSYFPQGSSIFEGAEVATAIAYTDAVTTVNRTFSAYTLTFGATTEIPTTWASPPYRCDAVMIGVSPGCVVPGVTPILGSMATLPNIAANIAAVQAAGPHHYGRKADESPLRRNTALEAANRAVACPDSLTRPTGQSCDEYPFARTDQGAAQTQQPDWGYAMVPVGEQNSQGGLLASFYKTYRVMDATGGVMGTGDAFWVAV
jgi:hypothetical protein